jgi:heat shock protein 4
MSVVGLDFGSQNALIAAAGRGGVDVVLNGNSQRLNAAMVGFGDSRSLGDAALTTATSNYLNTITYMKRLIGLSFNDPRAQAEMKFLPFKCVPISHVSGADSIGVQVNYHSEETVVSIEAVAGMLIKHMGSIVAAKSAESSTVAISQSNDDVNNPLFPKDWVISIPGYYTDAQRRALLVGCQIAGVEGIRRLMHEHTATALAYGIFKDIKKEFTKDSPTNVMFLDIGATSYSCCIVSFEPGKLIVKSAHFDPDLGGRLFDQCIAEWIATKFEEKFKNKLSAKPMSKPKVVLKLLAAAEKAKKTLSPQGVKEVNINLECLMDDFDFNCTLKASEYEELCAPLLARLAAPIQRALEETGLKASDMSSVEIVGGSTRIGCVKRTLSTLLGLDMNATNNGLSTTLNADEAIARGTALQSAILSPRFKVLPYDIIENQPFPVKISWDGDASSAQEGAEVEGEVEGADNPTNSVVMFDHGSNFSIVRRVTLRRSGEFVVTASYDDSADKYGYPQNCSKDIATFSIKAPKGSEQKIRVNVKQDINGCILLSSAQMVEEIVDDEVMTNGEGAAGEGSAEGAKQEEPDKKKKIKKTNLEFTESHPLEWTKAETDKAFEMEASMTNNDRLIRETSDKRNELESYIYDMRDRIISSSHLAPYATEEEKTSFSSMLENMENWLYEDGFDATKSVYSEKLKQLKAIGDPIESRQAEANARPAAMTSLKNTIEKYQSWLNTSYGQEETNHITDDEFSQCREKCDEVSSWMYDMMDKQGSLPLSQNPAVTVAEINAKGRELASTVNPVMTKPKPKPKEEKKEAEEKPATADEKSEENQNGAEPMDTESTPAADDMQTD